MAKVRGTAVVSSSRKRIGDLVFRSVGGGTVVSQRPASVTNPRTTAQMSQRVKLANVVNFYKASRRWMPKAFEFKTRAQSDYNAFVKANLAGNPVALTKQEAAQNACVVYPYEVAQGSLPPVTFNAATGGDYYLSNINLGDGGGLIEAGTGTTPPTFRADVTVGELSAVILANNLTPRAGYQISLLRYRQSANPVTGVPYVVCEQYEMVLDTADGRRLYNFMPTQGDSAAMFAGGEASAYVISIQAAAQAGFAMVVSNTEGGKTYVSQASVIVPDASNYSYYVSDAHRAEAEASYGENKEVFLDSNTADTAVSETQIQPTLLGFYITNTNGAYYPAGSKTPETIRAEAATLVLRINQEIDIPEEGAVVRIVGASGSGVGGWTAAQTTKTGNLLTGPVPTAGINEAISRITVTLADGRVISADFEAGID